MAEFEIRPVNKREGMYYSPGSVELHRIGKGGSTHWVISPRDIKKLLVELIKEHLVELSEER